MDNSLGRRARGASNTIRSPGVAWVMGGGLLGVLQNQPKPAVTAYQAPFVFSSPARIKTENIKTKSFAHKAYKSVFGRPTSAAAVPIKQPALNETTDFTRDITQTSYIDNKDFNARPVSAAPHKYSHLVNMPRPQERRTSPGQRLLNEYTQYQKRAAPKTSSFQKDNEIKRKEAELHARAIDYMNSHPGEYRTPEKIDSMKPAAKQAQFVDPQIEKASKIPITEPINKELEREKAKLETPEKLSNVQEIHLRHDLRRQMLRENAARQRLDMEISNNYREQNKMKDKIIQLQEQQREREFSTWANAQAAINKTMRAAEIREFAKAGKKDLTHYNHIKDESMRAYSKDRAHMKNLVQEQQSLKNQKMMLNAYNKHIARKSQFMQPNPPTEVQISNLAASAKNTAK